MPDGRLQRTLDAYREDTVSRLAAGLRERARILAGWTVCAGCHTMQPPSHSCQVYLPASPTSGGGLDSEGYGHGI